MAQDGVAVAIEHGHLIVAPRNTLATFMIEKDNIVRFVGFVVDDDVSALLAKSLDYFAGLGTRTSAAVGGQ